MGIEPLKEVLRKCNSGQTFYNATCHKGRYNVTTTHSYAGDSMPASEAFTIDGKNYTIQRSYDPGNRPLPQTFADGHVKAWSYDAPNLRHQSHL